MDSKGALRRNRYSRLVVWCVTCTLVSMIAITTRDVRPAGATTCTDYEFIGARGSGEPKTVNLSMGSEVFDEFTDLSNLLGTSFGTPQWLSSFRLRWSRHV